MGTGGPVEPDWRVPRPAWFPDEFAWVVGASYTGLPTVDAPVRNVWSVNMAVRRDVFVAVGGFRRDFGKVGRTSRPEDTDLCIRMSSSTPDGRWVYSPGAVVRHEVPAERSTIQYFLRRSFWEGQGKAEMARMLGHDRGLSSEKAWLLRTVPAGISRHLVAAVRSRDGREAAQVGALIAGTTAAGAGAASAVIRRGAVRRAAAGAAAPPPADRASSPPAAAGAAPSAGPRMPVDLTARACLLGRAVPVRWVRMPVYSVARARVPGRMPVYPVVRRVRVPSTGRGAPNRKAAWPGTSSPLSAGRASPRRQGRG